MTNLRDEMDDLESAEDFLTFFGIEYDAAVVHVSRLHILQRYHDYVQNVEASLVDDESALRARHRELLNRAYLDFVESSPLEERVFKVLKSAQGETFVSISDIEMEVS